MMKKCFNNKGYSLIEVLVVVAILATAVTAFSLSLQSVVSNQARQISSGIDAVLSKGKTNSVYRHPVVYVQIAIEGDNYVARVFEKSSTLQADQLGSHEVLGPTRVPITLNGFHTTSITPATPLRISFDRGTGQMRQITDLSDFGGEELTGRPQILVGNGRVFRIELVPRTGSHSYGSAN